MEAVQQQQLAVAFAALLVHDCGKAVDSNNIIAVLKSAGIKTEGWVSVMAKAFDGEKIEKLLEGFSSAAPVAAAAPAASAAAKTETKEEKKEEKKEEEEEDFGGFGDLF